MSAVNLLTILDKSNNILKSYEKSANLLADSIRVNFNEPHTLFIKKYSNGRIHYWDGTITIVAMPNRLFDTHTIGDRYTDYYFNESVYKSLRKLDKIHWKDWDYRSSRFTLRPVEDLLSDIIAMPFEKVQFIKVE